MENARLYWSMIWLSGTCIKRTGTCEWCLAIDNLSKWKKLNRCFLANCWGKSNICFYIEYGNLFYSSNVGCGSLRHIYCWPPPIKLLLPFSLNFIYGISTWLKATYFFGKKNPVYFQIFVLCDLLSIFTLLAVNRRLDEWVKLEQLDLDSVETVVDEKVEDKVIILLL